ncbi:MAG: CoA transferase [Burkholderiaceae bacterium]|nr:CoA transferase [Burkholderiaceae bacterium]
MIAGPYCTRLLADFGAEVIKCEPPAGDMVRATEPLRDGCSSYFGHLNIGKQSICLDLKRPAARALALDLACRCDVLIENYRPGVMARLGLDYARLKLLHPGLVYCAISGYGQSGPEAGRAAFAPIVHAASGYDLTNLRVQRGADVPARSALFVADYLGGMAALAAIEAALLQRVRTGVGQMIDLALVDAMLGMMSFEVQAAQFPVHEPTMQYAPTRARDGYFIAMPITQANFEALADATGHPHWRADPRFVDFTARKVHWDALMELLGAWAADRTAEECERVISAAGCPCSRYRTVAEAMASAQSRHRGVTTPAEDAAGAFLVTRPPWQMSAEPTTVRARAPALGEQGRDILSRVLGLEPAAIADLVGRGAFVEPDRPPATRARSARPRG